MRPPRGDRGARAGGHPDGCHDRPGHPRPERLEIPAILRAAAERRGAHRELGLLRLAPPIDALFVEWLDRHLPLRRDKVLHRIRECRAG